VLIALSMTFIASVTVCHGINANKFSCRYRCYFVAMLIYFLGGKYVNMKYLHVLLQIFGFWKMLCPVGRFINISR